MTEIKITEILEMDKMETSEIIIKMVNSIIEDLLMKKVLIKT